ncbi:MAG: helix-turn-helix transcriptional regulator [Candidatus Heimdallarchaeota archaeon]|nr:helix-turn-helix transcriptional regulator [Candidatus Heimdallarchaeota archaeon]
MAKKKKRSEDYGVKWSSRLKVFRAMKDLTQEDLAEKLDVTRQTISAIEKGNYNPSLILAYKIAREFQVSIEEVFIFKEETE